MTEKQINSFHMEQARAFRKNLRDDAKKLLRQAGMKATWWRQNKLMAQIANEMGRFMGCKP